MKNAILLTVRGFLLAMVTTAVPPSYAALPAANTLETSGIQRGIIAVIGPAASDVGPLMEAMQKGEAICYVQTADPTQADALRRAGEAAGLLGQRLFVDSGPLEAIHLGDNLADAVVCPGGQTPDNELLRVLRPRANAFTGSRKLLKPLPAGTDDWTHPYHGPDNNPQSEDQLARGDFQTQFLGFPMFSPMPQQSVVAGGRIFKAFGHIAHKANQNEVLNTLMALNAYNGTILWRRPLPAGFMIHRNTMIATEDALYLGDHESCKVFDALTGEVRHEFTVPNEISDGPVWKWMAMRDGVLYALVGNAEMAVDTQKSDRRGLGHWPWGMWQGHDYNDPRTAFGYGRTVVAMDVTTKKVLWHYRDQEFLDARGVCMNQDRIFCYSPERFLLALDLKTGKPVWKNSDRELLEAIGANERAQHYITGYATTCYIKCNQDRIFFAGPQRKQLVAASTADGRLAWTRSPGNLQLVLRSNALYAAGPQGTVSYKLDYSTGRVIAQLPGRRACTRATGGADSIFFRATGGTVRLFTDTDTAHHIAPMRPSCQDGVIISNGHLYWSPWMCGCQLSLYGNICLGPTGTTPRSTQTEDIYAGALETFGAGGPDVRPLKHTSADWPSYRANNARSDVTKVAIPGKVRLQWQVDASAKALPTAPVVSGGLVFLADRSGAVRAFDQQGKPVWKSYTAGPVYYPPAIANDRAYVGCADGRVYAFEAATGRLLWTFRVAPGKERIPVYGQLTSRWPVAGGVVVQDGTVYAAAGIAHYDGTYVVALDATTGKLQACNTTSGTLAPEVNGGISLQGELMIDGGELRFLGGGVYEVARYDLKTLKCLNEPKVQINSQYHTAFYPYFTDYGKYVSLDYACQNGCNLTHDASYEGSRFSNLALEAPRPTGVNKVQKDMARWNVFPKPGRLKPIWEDKTNRRFTSFIVSAGRLLATGHIEAKPEAAFLTTINISDGSDFWTQPLPAVAVKGGTAMDHEGRIYTSLENGQLLCFAP